jgi:hypothetical protein
MVETGETWSHAERARRAGQYRRRHAARAARLERERVEVAPASAEQKKRATIEKAMQRASQRLRDRNR